MTDQNDACYSSLFPFIEIFNECCVWRSKEQQVELLCDNELMKSVIDRFGEAIKTEKNSDSKFKAIVTVSVSKTFYAWAFRFAGQMKIAGPENVKQEYLEMAKKVLE